MQIAIVRTVIFDRQVLPVLKQQAIIARCSLGDHIRSILYKAHGYIPKTSGLNTANQMLENMANKTSNGKTLIVNVDQDFYYRFNIPGRMKVVNKILYEAAGCRQLCR